MAFKIISQPTNEPVSLAEAKAHLRLDDSGEDALILALIRAARETVEQITGRATTSRYCSQTFSGFGSGLALQYPPVSAISGVAYIDGSGTSQTLASSGYQTDLDSLPPRVLLGVGCAWPDVQAERNLPITVSYVAGYGASGTDVPEAMRLATKMLVGHWYANREAVTTGTAGTEVPMAVTSLLMPLRARGMEG